MFNYMGQRMSNPPMIAGTGGAALAAAAQALAAALRQYQKTADMGQTWTGSASQAHNDRLAKLVDAASRVIQAITQAQALTTAGGAQLTALKLQNDAITTSALSSQFLVFPSGQVIPGPAHHTAAAGPHYAAAMRAFWAVANAFTGQINGTVTAGAMSDAQLAGTIIGIAAQFFADLLSEKEKNPLAGQVNLTPGLSDPGAPGALPPGLTPPPFGPIDHPDGTQLAGVSDLGGVGPLGPGGIGGLGPGGLTGGPGGLGGVGGLGPAGLGGIGGLGPAGIGPGGVGQGGVLAAGRPGVIGAGAAGTMGAGAGGPGAAGAAGAMGRGGVLGGSGMMPMVPMGGQGAGGSDQGHSADTWLHEDQDPFDPDEDAPGSVLS